MHVVWVVSHSEVRKPSWRLAQPSPKQTLEAVKHVKFFTDTIPWRIQTIYITVIRRCHSHSTCVGNVILTAHWAMAHYDSRALASITASHVQWYCPFFVIGFHDRAPGLRPQGTKVIFTSIYQSFVQLQRLLLARSIRICSYRFGYQFA